MAQPKILTNEELATTLEVMEMLAGTCFNVPYLPHVAKEAAKLRDELKKVVEFREVTGWVGIKRE